MIFPEIYKRLVYMEDWKLESTVSDQLAVRYYIARFWGLATILFVNIYFNLYGNSVGNLLGIKLIGINVTTLGCPGSYTLNLKGDSSSSGGTLIDSTLYSKCSEDETIINLLFIAIADIIIRVLYDLIAYSFLHCCSKRKKLGESFKWSFSPGKTAADLFMNFIMLNLVVYFFPYFSALIPLILFIYFKYVTFKLKSLRSNPDKFNIRQENGYIIMLLFTFTIVISLAINLGFYISYFPHNNKVVVIKFLI